MRPGSGEPKPAADPASRGRFRIASGRRAAVVIGCNTLSVLYPDTDFAKTARVPVLDIVAPGVALFRRELARAPDAALLLFGSASANKARGAKAFMVGVSAFSK
jgi:hypothetical protein